MSINNYEVIPVPVDIDMAKTLYYKGIAITLQSWYTSHKPLIIHYDSVTKIAFTKLLFGYSVLNDIGIDHINLSIDVKGEKP